jgi:enterochelin esterase-like enzyme
MARALPLALLMMVPSLPLAQPLPFDGLLAALAEAPRQERQGLVEAFWDGLPRTPILENDTSVVFLYRGEAQHVELQGDMSGWDSVLPLTRIEGTDLWYLRGTFEPEARLEYLFLVNQHTEGFGAALLGVPDPHNPDRVLSGFGPFSELAMPGYAYHPAFDAVRDGTPGSSEGLALHEVPPGALPYPHEVLVYTPPGYAASSSDRHPTLYFVDGRDYVEFAHVPAVLDALIGAGEIEPVLAVFVDPPNRHGASAPNRTTEYGMSDAFVAFLADELVPYVDARYRTRTGPADRLIVGDSYGGLIATYVGFARPEVFGKAYSQSGYHSFQGDRMIRLIAESEPRPIRLVVDVGTYERSVGVGLLPEAEIDFLEANRRLRAALEARGYDFVYAEHPEGHTWGYWRGRLPAVLPHFFPPSEG